MIVLDLARPEAPPRSAVLAYHLLGRRGRPSKWNVLLGLVVVLVLSVLFTGVLLGVAYSVHDPRLDAGSPDADLVWELAVLGVAIACLVPAALLTARWVDGRPAGTLSSVAGRVRWRWLLTCTMLAAPVAVLGGGIALIVDPPAPGWDGVDWDLLAVVVAVLLVTIPFQAAGEEYLFRGYLPQLIGRLTTNPWIPAIALSFVFAAIHGTEQDAWSFVDRAFFGLAAAWLTIRTGGLEAAIALHAVGNIAGFTLLTVDGGLRGYLTGPEPPLTAAGALLDMALVAVVAFAMVRLSDRRRLAGQFAQPAGT